MPLGRRDVENMLVDLSNMDWERYSSLQLPDEARGVIAGVQARKDAIRFLIEHYDVGHRGLDMLVPHISQPLPQPRAIAEALGRGGVYAELSALSPSDWKDFTAYELDAAGRGVVDGVHGRDQQTLNLIEHFDVHYRGLSLLTDMAARVVRSATPSEARMTVQSRGATLRQTSVGDGMQRMLRAGIGDVGAQRFFFEATSQMMRVCRVDVGTGGGTGYLVSENEVLTAYHVIRDVHLAYASWDQVTVRFDHHDEVGSFAQVASKLESSTRWLGGFATANADELAGSIQGVIPGDRELDFAVLRLAEPQPKRLFGGGGLPTHPPTLAEGAPISILQHPKGKPMRWAIDTDGVQGYASNGRRLRYHTNTDEGSSGAPVFDLNWNLVALHHYGSKTAGFNQGVTIQHIRQEIERQHGEA